MGRPSGSNDRTLGVQRVQLQPQQERAEAEPHEQQQGRVQPQQMPEEAELQRLRLRDLPDPALARLVHGPLPSPPVPSVQSLSSSQWTRHSPLSHVVSPEPYRSRYRADGPFHLVLHSRVPPPPVLPQPPESSFTVLHDPLCDYLCASRPVVSRVLSALVTHPTAPLSSVSALVTTVAGFASSHRLDYAAHVVSGPPRSLSSGCASVFLLEVLEDMQFELGFLAAAVPHHCAMLLTPEGDPDALDTPIPRTHAKAVSGPWASYWIAGEETEMSSYRSTGTYILTRFRFPFSKVQLNPLDVDHGLTAPPSDESFESSTLYPELVGCLMYLMTCTRPDLAYPLSILTRFVALGRHCPSHWYAAKRMAKYVASTSGMGLVLGGKQPVTLTGFSDSSWANDVETRRSTKGSSYKAEVYAAAKGSQKLRWLSFLLTDLGERPRSPPVLFANNRSAVLLCEEPQLVMKAKHIQLRYFLLRELQQRGQALV
ncbi:unnamed protein product [Closterium sp. NIES-53]